MKPIISAALMLGAATATWAEYPDKPITIVVPFAAGGPTDKVARDLGDVMRSKLNQIGRAHV